MKNIMPLMKRVCAYSIDLFIVLIIATVISSIPLFNKNKEEYQKTYDEYNKTHNEYLKYIELLESSFKDDEINEEEYNNLIEIENYQEIIISRYDDNKISKGEYKKIYEEINNKYENIANEYLYILSKKGISNSIITLSCTLLYFGIIQYFLKGQTIGKKLLQLKVVSVSNKKINILNYILRSLIVNEILLNAIGIVILFFASKSVYTSADKILSILVSCVEAVIIFLVITREDGRGLHDLLFNTKVISIEENREIKTNQKKVKNKIIEADYKEESE